MNGDEIAMDSLDPEERNVKENSVSKIRKELPQYVAAIVVNIISFTYGVSAGWTSPALPQLQSENSPIGGDAITEEDASWLGSLICLGAITALPVYSYVSETFGRKIAGCLVAIPFITGWQLTYVAKSVTTLYFARFITGLGSGGMLLICPMYVSEISEDNIRGALGSYLLLFINGGVVFAYIIGAYISYHGFALIGLVLPAVYLLTFIWLPETPFYLVSKGKTKEATKSLGWLRGNDSAVVERELQMLERTNRESREAVCTTKVSIRDLVSSRAARRAGIIGLVLSANQQFSGAFAIVTYTQSIFEESGSSMQPEVATIVVGTLQFIGSFLCSFLMDRAGRKILVIFSNVVMAICLGGIGLYFYLKHIESDTSFLNWLPVTSLSVYIVAFALGMGPVPFVMISEIFSPQVRGLATWACITLLWMLAFVVSKFFISLSNVLGKYGCFWLFSICCILGAIFAVFYIPETKNKSIEEILKELNGEITRKSQSSSDDNPNVQQKKCADQC